MIVCALALRPPTHSLGFAVPAAGKVTTDDFGWGARGPMRRWYTGSGLYYEAGFNRYLRVDVSVLQTVHLPAIESYAIGVSSSAIGDDFYVLDLLGLADPFTARLRAPSNNGPLPLPGHEKPLPTPWVAARLFPANRHPPPSAFPQTFLALIPSADGREFQQQVVLAREALNCPPIVRLARSVKAPLTPKRFLDNLAQSFANSFLRIPPDPAEAFRSLCGSRARP